MSVLKVDNIIVMNGEEILKAVELLGGDVESLNEYLQANPGKFESILQGITQWKKDLPKSMTGGSGNDST